MKIKVSRPKQIMDMGRPYFIRTEAKELGTLNAGESIEVEIPKRANELFATVVWYFSNGIAVRDLKDGDELIVKNRCDGWKLLIPLVPMYYIMKKTNYLALDKVEKPEGTLS